MVISSWTLLALFFLPLGILIAFLLLSGLQPLIWLGLRFSKIQVQLGFLALRLPTLITCFSCLCVLVEWNSLWRVTRLRNSLLLSNMPNEYAWKANLWRHQRNWWLSLTNFFLWLVICRVSHLIQNRYQRSNNSSSSVKTSSQ